MLMAAREPIVMLAEQQGIEELRRKKQIVTVELQAELKSLLESIKKLDSLLPEKELKEEVRRHLREERDRKKGKKTKVSKKKSKKTSVPAIPAADRMSDIDRLEYTLRKIDAKLQELGE